MPRIAIDTLPNTDTHVEVARLPGCGAKIAELYHQWGESGKLNEITQASLDERLTVLGLFYNIWGVGDTTAREFYNKGRFLYPQAQQ